MQAILINEDGPHEGRRRWIRPGEQLTVGASAWADVVVESKELLPIHLLIDLSHDGCAVHSVSGSLFEINGETKTQAWLSNGDKIRIADALFRVELQGESTAGPVRRIDLATSVLPAAHRQELPAEDRLRCREHDSQFLCFTPGNYRPLNANEVAEEIAKLVPLFGLCRFDRWRFPCPEALSQSSATVPKAGSPQAIPHLPLLFPMSHVENADELRSEGLDAGNMILLASHKDFEAILEFLRDAPGLFLSPTALKNVIAASQEGALGAILGPIDAVLLGTNQEWVLYGRRETFPDIDRLLDDTPMADTRES